MKTQILSIAAAALLLVACNDKKDEPTTTTETESTAQEGTAAEQETTEELYACSMHPEVTGNKNDLCSKCQMKLTEPAIPGGRVDDPR